MSKPIKIMYMGTPEFAVPALSVLEARGYDIVSVVTQPDRPRGRGHKLTPSPVKTKAEELGLPVLQPESLRNNTAWDEALAKAAPDLIVVCAYGKILPKETLETPHFGCVNIHASLLPKYRGAAPIHRAVEAGDSNTGITLMFMSEGLDEGDMIAAKPMSIEGMNSGEVTGALATIGAELLVDELPAIIGGTAIRTPQAAGEATYAPPVQKEEGRINFDADAKAVCRKILAMTPSPGAYAFLGDEKTKLIRAKASARPESAGLRDIVPGMVLSTDGGTINVASGRSGIVAIEKLQSPGGKPMGSADWLRGHKIENDAMFK
jgi:methionyl-tRNA formyltransferase